MTLGTETEPVQPVEVAKADIEVIQEVPLKPRVADHVLLVGGEDWAMADVTSQLHAAGRTVHRCCDSASAPFPCNAMVPGRSCPLDHEEVDVVLVIRSRPLVEPSLADMGAVCGIRDGLPIVVAGLSEDSGFGPWAEEVAQAGDIVATCDEIVKRVP